MSQLDDDLKRLDEMRATGEVTAEEYKAVRADLLADKVDSSRAENRPAGWYDDPDGFHSHQAFWDGEAWTGETRPLPGSQTTTRGRSKTFQRVYLGSAKRVFVAATRAVANLGYSITTSDSNAGVLSFSTGFSLRSFGQSLTITVVDLGGGRSQISIGGSTGILGGGSVILHDWGEKGAIAQRLLTEVATILASAPEPSSDKPALEGVGDLADQLSRLVELHAAGAITADEFAAAKKKILG